MSLCKVAVLVDIQFSKEIKPEFINSVTKRACRYAGFYMGKYMYMYIYVYPPLHFYFRKEDSKN